MKAVIIILLLLSSRILQGQPNGEFLFRVIDKDSLRPISFEIGGKYEIENFVINSDTAFATTICIKKTKHAWHDRQQISKYSDFYLRLNWGRPNQRVFIYKDVDTMVIDFIHLGPQFLHINLDVIFEQGYYQFDVDDYIEYGYNASAGEMANFKGLSSNEEIHREWCKKFIIVDYYKMKPVCKKKRKKCCLFKNK